MAAFLCEQRTLDPQGMGPGDLGTIGAGINGGIASGHVTRSYRDAQGNILTRQGEHADALKVLMTADTTDLVVMNRIAEAHAALGHSADATTWNKRILDNYNLNLEDVRESNARRRAREEIAVVRTPQ